MLRVSEWTCWLARVQNFIRVAPWTRTNWTPKMARILSPLSISPQAISKLQQIRSRLLDVPEKSTAAIKVLQQPLIGKHIYQYYPPDVNPVKLAVKNPALEHLKLLDLDLEVRRRKEETLKSRNKRVWFQSTWFMES
jgi:hypothetical protein